ncbi:ubiquinol-cytochrome c reductase iron-sulfur subunit [Saccharicrinis sp. FJH62]|uniref:QcrA and Rieske domain-containing protein n=1 Tax=Saccharicrinis sp. FJH62 TaxID=3344657 RepID=UPI0035D4A8C1
MERKEFIKKLTIGGSVLFASPLLFNACTEDNGMVDNHTSNDIVIDLNDAAYSELSTVGGFAYKDNIIIFRTGTDTYMALSKLCTHQQCTVSYNHSSGTIPCPCHGSIYSTSGEVLNGPATQALKQYTVTKDGNTLILK